MKWLGLILKNLRRNRRRSILTVLSLTVSLFIFCALMSVPLRLDTELTSIPAAVPYLEAEDRLVARWRAPLGANGFKVGIAWQGAPA